MGKHSEIKQLIRSIASTGGGATLFEATVVESKDTECTIKYQGLEQRAPCMRIFTKFNNRHRKTRCQ